MQQPIFASTAQLCRCLACNRVYQCQICFDAHESPDSAPWTKICALKRFPKPGLCRGGLFIPQLSLMPCSHNPTPHNSLCLLRWLNLCRNLVLTSAQLLPAMKHLLRALLPLKADNNGADLLANMIQPYIGPALNELHLPSLQSSVEKRALRSRYKGQFCSGSRLVLTCFKKPQWYCVGCCSHLCNTHQAEMRCLTCFGKLLLVSIRSKLMCVDCSLIFASLTEAQFHIETRHLTWHALCSHIRVLEENNLNIIDFSLTFLSFADSFPFFSLFLRSWIIRLSSTFSLWLFTAIFEFWFSH
jgi:hypothetical protein